MYTTEVRRIMQGLEQLSEDALLQKFHSASRADVKLACTLLCQRRGNMQEPLQKYLLSRLRPAVTEMILADDVSALSAMDSYGIYTEYNTDAFLKEAVNSGAQECTVWLLKLKARHFGFWDRDFSL